MPSLAGVEVGQIGVIVPDARRAMEEYARVFGMVEWQVGHFDEAAVAGTSYRGGEGRFALTIAFSTTATPQIELIEWNRGACLHGEWASAGRFGVHHAGIYVSSIRDAVADMQSRGFEPVQAKYGIGLDGDGGFAYVDTSDALGMYLELIEIPKRRPSRELVLTEAVGAIDALAGANIAQLGLVVPDIDPVLEKYVSMWGISPWRVWAHGPHSIPEMTYAGRPAEYAMTLALSAVTPQIELIESEAGPNIYDDWSRDGRAGVHHLGVLVDSIEPASAELAEQGFTVIQSGARYGAAGDGTFAYFDTEGSLGTTLELIEPPKRRRDPDRVYPPKT